MNQKKTVLTVLCFLITAMPAIACELCKKNQPRGLEDITHGAGPTGYMDYVIGWSAVIIVLVTFFLSVKYLIDPKETSESHIKNRIANGEI